MDLHDHNAGQSDSHAWFRAKKDLLCNLCAIGDVPPKSRILNLGAGTGDDLDVLKEWGDVYVIDINEEVLKHVPDHLCVEKTMGSACDLPYDDNFFDAVVSLDVFEHIDDHIKAVQETHRVLKPGGVLLCTVPAHQWLFSAHDVALEHYRRYSFTQLKTTMKEFAVVQMGYWNVFLFPAIAVLRLLTKNSPPKPNHLPLPQWVHSVLYRILATECWLILHRIPLPIGLTLFGVFRKQDTANL